MASSAAAIWQESTLPFPVAMQRTERTYERTNARLQDPPKFALVPNAPTPVDNPDLVDSIEAHRLVGIDGYGSRCSCGDHSTDRLEHLGQVALTTIQPSSYITPDQEWKQS